MFEPVRWQGGNAKEPPSVFRRYTELNTKRGLEEIDLVPAHNRRLYLVCSGPSLLDTWHELKSRDGEIWALNAAWDYLCKQGIRADYGVCLAPENRITHYFNDIREWDRFLFAAQTHPELIERALERGASVTLWHTKHPDEWDMPGPQGKKVYGGGTVGSRAFELAYVMGFRDVHVLGMDACNSYDGRIAVETPMYDDRKDDLRVFIAGGRAFLALPSHARQVEDFASVIRPLTGMEVTFYGDGLMQWATKAAQENT